MDFRSVPRITLETSKSLGFTMQRDQFPVNTAFAMTIHKSQRQTFEYVGIDLTTDVFNHGQLYVSFSRAKRWFEDIAKQGLANTATKCGLERNPN